jgi:carboxypeptidase Taq
MSKHLEELLPLIWRIYDIHSAAALLEWDQQTYMPPKGAEARGQQIATLRRMAHELHVSDEYGHALSLAQGAVEDLDPDSDEACLVREVSRQFQKKRRVPAEWVGEFSETTSQAIQAWQQARSESDFSLFKPHLERVVALRAEYASFFEPYDFIYDPLLDDFEPDMKTGAVRRVFDELRPAQVELIQSIADRGTQVDDSPLHQDFDPKAQWDFGIEVVKRFGYDFSRGRQDKSAHPFTTAFGWGDVRITTRIYPNYIPSGLLSTMHEAGHGMYEQGVKADLARTPLMDGASLAIHESQSRMWENIVGRGLPFWQAFFPRLQEYFPEQLGDLDVGNFYRIFNKVEPSLIRVEADEATYNLHIMLRFDLEIALLQGELAVEDLPQAWNEKMHEYLGIVPPDDSQGVLQDIHWASGILGYFPTYALGNLVASQLWARILHDIPNLEQQISKGTFADLLAWLREHIHQHGAKFAPLDLLERATGEELNPAPYLGYLSRKYGEIYHL